MKILAIIFVNLFLIYLLLGLLFSIAFVIKGVQKVDSVAADTNWKFRLLILPGAMAFWPILLKKWLRAK